MWSWLFKSELWRSAKYWNEVEPKLSEKWFSIRIFILNLYIFPWFCYFKCIFWGFTNHDNRIADLKVARNCSHVKYTSAWDRDLAKSCCKKNAKNKVRAGGFSQCLNFINPPLFSSCYSNVGRLFCTPAPPKFTKKLAVDSFFNFGSWSKQK